MKTLISATLAIALASLATAAPQTFPGSESSSTSRKRIKKSKQPKMKKAKTATSSTLVNQLT